MKDSLLKISGASFLNARVYNLLYSKAILKITPLLKKFTLVIVSHSKKFIVLLPWKTASQTLAQRLQDYNQSPYSGFFSFNPYLNRVIHQHLTCSDFFGLPEAALGYYLVSFVRNPYDRVYAGFRQVQRDLVTQPKMQFEKGWVKELVLKQLKETQLKLIQANHDFDNWVELLDEYEIYEQGRNTNFPLHPSYYWTHLGGKQYVDFIGKVENFENDLEKFSNIAGIPSGQKINSNTTELLAQSKIGPIGYRYVDRMKPSSIKKINSLFSKDFELFDYSIINPT